jgi:hypothetical protein
MIQSAALGSSAGFIDCDILAHFDWFYSADELFYIEHLVEMFVKRLGAGRWPPRSVQT